MEAVRPLPKWAMYKYSLLWRSLSTKEFSFETISRILNEQKPNLVSVLLTHLKRNGWIEVKLDPEDSRKRVYVLKTPEKVMEEIAAQQNE